jgi:hypothetical protein
VEYADAVSGDALLAACVALDDSSVAAGENPLFGVICMDVNLGISVADLSAKQNYWEFVADYEGESRTCEQAGVESGANAMVPYKADGFAKARDIKTVGELHT